MSDTSQIVSVNFGLLHRKMQFNYEIDIERLPTALKQYKSDLEQFTPQDLQFLRWRMLWKSMAREKQLPPKEFEQFEKMIWGIRSGRGFGKTLTGSNWLGIEAYGFPSMYCVVAPTKDDVRYTSCSADTLVLTATGERQIIDIREGEFVLTRKGWRRVLWSGQTGVKRLMSITAGGRTVRLTDDHRVWSETRSQFLPASKLNEGETVLVWSTSPSTGMSSDDTQNQSTELTGCTSQELIEERSASYIERCGLRITGAFRKGITFITQKTKNTIRYSISNALHLLNTTSITRTALETGASQLGDLLSSNECDRAPNSKGGIELKRGARSPEKTQSLCSQRQLNPRDTTALSVESVSSRSEQLGSNTVRRLALTRVNDVSGKPEPVYDLTVEGEPEFYANGILVHNCFEGPTGLYAVIPPQLIIDKNLALPSITLYGGSIIRGFAGDTPERLRGPQHAKGWLDEIACLVAGTLVQTLKGAVPIELIREGDLVWTRKGLRKVLACGISSESAELWEMVSSDGSALVGTGHHPVWSESQGAFVPLSALQHGCILTTWQPTSSFGMENAGTGGRITTRTERASCSIEPSTQNFVELFRHATKYITKTRTHATIGLATWLQCLTQSTNDCIQRASYYGVVDEYLSNAARNGLAGSPERSPASFVPSASELQGNGLSSARRSAGTLLTDTREPSTSVVSVKALGRQGVVYNLDVEDAHEFYANGILTHNSWLYPQDAWDNLMFGLRLGTHPQVCVTGTPKPSVFIRDLVKRPDAVWVTGSTYENSENLTPSFFENVAKYEGTRKGRQEIHGEVLDPEEAGIVKRSQWKRWPSDKPLPRFQYIVYSLDTAFTEKDHDKKKQTSDPTACSVWGLFSHGTPAKKNIMLLDCWEEWLGFPALIKRVKKERSRRYGATIDGPAMLRPLIGGKQTAEAQGKKIDLILIEDKASGRSLIQSLAAEEIFAEPYNPGGQDKLERLNDTARLWSHGRVWAVESNVKAGEFRNWAEPLIGQVCTYSGEGSLTYDDLLDTATQAAKYFLDNHIGSLTIPHDVEEERRKAALAAKQKLEAKRKRNPYDG